MNELIARDMKRVVETLSRESRIKELSREGWKDKLIADGGKLLRPKLVVVTARMCGVARDEQIDFAVALELLHNSTLFHDDVIDLADMRRGKATLNSRFGDSFAILAGDYLVSRCFSIINRHGIREATAEVAECYERLVAGQLLELEHESDLWCGEDVYDRIIAGKTVALIRACVRVGAIVSRADDKLMGVLSDIASGVGHLFQIADDVYDYLCDEARSGKRRFQDLREGKMTLPAIIMKQKSEDDDLDFLKRCLGDRNVSPASCEKLLNIMNDYGVFADIGARYRAMHDSVVTLFAGLPDNEYADDFRQLISVMVDRIYDLLPKV